MTGSSRQFFGRRLYQIDHAVVAVRNADETAIVGAAFFVRPNELLTCAHVVARALGLADNTPVAPDEPVALELPLTDPPTILRAVAVPESWRPGHDNRSGDIAILRLTEPPPKAIRPLPLAASGPFWRRRCEVFGFPGGRPAWFEGKLTGLVRQERFLIVAESGRGFPPEPGYSGAPVWYLGSRTVRGMVVQYEEKPERRSAYMIPSRSLIPVVGHTPHGPRPDGAGAAALVNPIRQAAKRVWTWWTAAIVAAVVLLAGLIVVFGPLSSRTATCAVPTQLRVAVSPGSVGPYQAVAQEYEQSVAERHGGCRAVSLYVYPVSPDLDPVAPPGPAQSSPAQSGPAQSGPARSGPPQSGPPRPPGVAGLFGTGLHPDVWLPGDSATVDQISRAVPGVKLDFDTIGRSPLVLAVPEKLYDPKRDDKYRSGGLTWPDLFRMATSPAGTSAGGGLTGVGWPVVRPDPEKSLVGRLATAALYDGLTDDPASLRQNVEQRIEQAQDNGAYPPGDDTALLCRQVALTGPGAPAAAVITTEQAVVQYNMGKPIGGDCLAHRGPTDPQLVPFYPTDTPTVSQVLIQLTWDEPWQSPQVRQAATDFRHWLDGFPGQDSQDGKAALLSQGLRPSSYGIDDAGQRLLSDYKALPDWPFLHDPAEPIAEQTQDHALKLYAAAHRPGRILVLLDTSGSMRTAAGDGRRTRFEIAVDGVRSALGSMGGEDEFGLWLFSTAFGGGIQTVVPLGPQQGGSGAAQLAASENLRPTGDTPLYRAIDAGIKAVRADDGSGRDLLRAVVVLTDGQDTVSGGLVPDISGGSQTRVFVVAIGETSCDVSVLRTVTEGTGGQCFNQAASGVDQMLSSLFETLWQRGSTP